MPEILILVPQFQQIFNWIITNNTGLFDFLKKLEQLDRVKVTLKFHPRHGRYEFYKPLIDYSKFNIECGDNFMEILDRSTLVIAMESSSALVDCILKEKPLVYINDYIHQFDDEYVYHRLLDAFECYSFKELEEFLFTSDSIEEGSQKLVPKLTSQDVLFASGDKSRRRMNTFLNDLRYGDV